MTTAALACPPAWSHVPEHVGTYGDEVADLGETAGLFLDPEQRLLIDAMYAHDAKGRFAASEVGCCAPRQNVKSHVGKVAALADLVLFEDPLGLWTAHLRATSDKTFVELVEVFENYDHLRRLVDGKPKDSDGEQSITLRRSRVGAPAPKLEFMARSERGGRGLSGNRVTFDEALFLKPAMLAAMVPVLSARSLAGDVQVRYLGSAGLQASASWREVRDQGRAGTAKKLAWLEWAAPVEPCDQDDCSHEVGVAGCALDRPHLIEAANLALGRRIALGYVLDVERLRLPPVDFMRERLGWWDDPPEGAYSRISSKQWDDIGEAGSQIVGTPWFAVDVTPDRSSATVAAAGMRADGLLHVEVVRNHQGTGWVVDLVAAAAARAGVRDVCLDAGGPAGSLVGDLEADGLTVYAASANDLGQACGALVDRVAQSRLRHIEQHSLTAAVKGASTRNLGDGAWAWSRKSSAVDISPLVACTLAGWRASTGSSGPEPRIRSL